MDPHGNGVVSKTNDVFATISPVFETHGISPTFTLLPKLLFSLQTELSEKQQKERRNMNQDKLDCVMECIIEKMKRQCENQTNNGEEILNLAKALTEVVSARASLPVS